MPAGVFLEFGKYILFVDIYICLLSMGMIFVALAVVSGARRGRVAALGDRVTGMTGGRSEGDVRCPDTGARKRGGGEIEKGKREGRRMANWQ